ncbi:hypothetical protein [Streptomyces sp. NPDC006997]|uniref:hypothetical protein n=1 Tax=Streptomyces sp. NPDC006997 TaxID=3155356 RepID=UPI0033DAC01E
MRLTRPMLALGGAALALALVGCGADGDQDAVPETATGSLEHLAAEARCQPDIQIDADELRQALCKGAADKYVLLTFATDRGQREWINEAKDYGGYYLVGRKWLAVGHEDVVTRLRATLGGDIEVGADHSGAGHSGAGRSGGHGGHGG